MFCVPYLGSKAKIVKFIFNKIQQENADNTTKIFVDIFCGGFAVGYVFWANGWKVIANDKNKYIVALLDKLFNSDTLPALIYKFVKREEFFDILKYSDRYEEWYVGFVMNIYSFGNEQTWYLYGEDIEPYKEAAHDLIVHKNPETIKKIVPDLPCWIIEETLNIEDLRERKIFFCNKIYSHAESKINEMYKNDDSLEAEYKKYEKITERQFTREEVLTFTTWLKNTGITAKEINEATGSYMASHYLSVHTQPAIPTLEMWGKIKEMLKSKAVDIPEYIENFFVYCGNVRHKVHKVWNLEKLEKLKQIEHLERIEKLKRATKHKLDDNLPFVSMPIKDNLTLLSRDYREVEIPKGSIVYCDPPYEGHTEYYIDGFNHKEFWDWARKQSKYNKVYISSYKAPQDFAKILEIKKASTLQGGTKANQPPECLFVCKLPPAKASGF